MAIKQISPIHLDEGHQAANGVKLVGGMVVMLTEEDGVNAALSGEGFLAPANPAADGVPYGFCYKGNALPESANNLYIPFNQYKTPLTGKDSRFSVILTKGARVELWNDGTGNVFDSTINANTPAGTPLYVANGGILTTTAGDNASLMGGIQVAVVEKAPADAQDVLVARIEL